MLRHYAGEELYGAPSLYVSCAYRGLVDRKARLSISLASVLRSMGGIPPIVGFFAKIDIFRKLVASEVSVGIRSLSIMVAILASVVTMAFYLHLLFRSLLEDTSSIYMDDVSILRDHPNIAA